MGIYMQPLSLSMKRADETDAELMKLILDFKLISGNDSDIAAANQSVDLE